MFSYISGTLSFFFLVWSVSKIGLYHSKFVNRSIKYEEARFLLQSDACTDPRRRAVLSELCMNSQKITYTKPWLGALFDTADELSIPYTQNLPKIIICTLIVAVVVLMASGIQIKRNNEKSDADYWRLPIKNNAEKID